MCIRDSFDSETAREVLRDHGCWEDADGCTHFPRTLVESALEAVPAEFVHRGRTPDDDIHMAQDQVYASNFGEGIFTHDLETGERRSTVKQDAVDILRVVDSLDNIHIYNRAIGPQMCIRDRSKGRHRTDGQDGHAPLHPRSRLRRSF